MNFSPVYDEWREKTLAEGREQGISQGQMGLLKQQVVAKFENVSDRALSQVDRLPSEKLTELAMAYGRSETIALLAFERMVDLENWLGANGVE